MNRTKAVVTAAVGVVAAAGIVTGAAALANANEPTATYAGAAGQLPGDTVVTGAEKAKVAAAVTAKDSAVTVTEVRKGPDGSYHVAGTKAGANVRFEVSSDLSTITARTGGPGGGHGGHGGRGGLNDTVVTGAEKAKVAAAVTAKDSAVTVTEVRKGPDGSYHVAGTKAGANVRFEVSSDLSTITARTGGPGGGPGGHGGHGGRGGLNDTVVTGAEQTKVAAAVTAKDSAVTVTEVRKDPDGSYHVAGTKAGANVRFEVSSDLSTITARTGGPGGHGGRGGLNDTAVTGAEQTKIAAAVTAKDSAVTVTEVRKDPDGSYDVVGTKAGTKVRFEVSSDLSTITARGNG